ncbi:MAG TPA: DUF3570 domain-containing protein [Polyangiales bacterium]|nr:DUF3570 domain-containing protein [Polyangiales bacterium]
MASAFAWTRGVAAQQAASAVYVRSDTDQTLVITPRVSVQAPIDDSTRVDVAYSADVWSSASVDIRTSASRAVTERRDEINASVSHDFSDISLSVAYRYSYEPDYVSNSASLGLKFDFANKASTLELGGGASFDDVGRAGDPNFDRSLQTFTGQLTFTQVLDPDTLLQGVYTMGYSDGYLSSPYRYIGLGSWNGACGSDIPGTSVPVGPSGTAPGQLEGLQYCLPEKNPDERLRNAFVLRGARALGDAFSLALAYRFYFDDWDVMSHTVLLDFNWLPDDANVLALRYRFYLQNAAFHYKSRFPASDAAPLATLPNYYTRDKELSPFSSHRLAVEWEREWPLHGSGESFRLVLSVGPTLYLYSDFIPYQRIFAFEGTVSGVLVL